MDEKAGQTYNRQLGRNAGIPLERGRDSDEILENVSIELMRLHPKKL
jgi:hypothetical protein